LRNAFARRTKQTAIDTACLDKLPKQGYEAPIGDTFANAFQQQAVMNGIEVAGKVAFYHPAARRLLLITFL
jgi:hypothetical protein